MVNLSKKEAKKRRIRSFIVDTILLIFSSAVCAIILLRFLTD
jgi:hypothetical protein